MTRKEFLSLLGVGGASLVVSACIGGCSKTETTPAPSGIDLNLDLNAATYSSLKTKGNFVNLPEGIVVAYGLDGNYYAVQLSCPHGEGGRIQYNQSLQKFRCDNHTEQNFTTSGDSNNARTSSNLKTYVCTLNGNTLNVKG
jgi:nitrite reductase/ring-hydroxylating ferredoxin subunit